MKAPDTVLLSEREHLDHAIAQASLMGVGHLIELLHPARDGHLQVAMVLTRDANLPMRILRNATKPTLVLVGDDDQNPTGPAGWPIAPDLVRWARSAIVHGSGADRSNYALAAGMTVLCGRLLLVETSSVQAPAWVAALRDAVLPVPVLEIRATGGVHPIRPSVMH